MWLLIELELISTLALAQPVVLGDETLTLALVSREDRELCRRLKDAARSPAKNVVLLLKGVAADAPPQASWEVHVGRAGAKHDAEGASLVGVVALFGEGVRSEGSGRPAEFVFVLDRAIAAAGAMGLEVTFAPIAAVDVDGKAAPAAVRSTVTIGEISLAIDAASAQP